MANAILKTDFQSNGFIGMVRNNLPAENTKNQIQHKKRSQYNQRHEVDPIVQCTECIIRLICTGILQVFFVVEERHK